MTLQMISATSTNIWWDHTICKWNGTEIL